MMQPQSVALSKGHLAKMEPSQPELDPASLQGGDRELTCGFQLFREGSKVQAHLRFFNEDGAWTAFAARLPGVTTFGHSINEAVANAREAFLLALESYAANSAPIPWLRPDEPDLDLAEPGTEYVERWIVVDVETPA